MNFLEFITKLAPEGETALIVKQKPLKPLQYHADGAIKATWPAYLPSKHDGIGAWYGNTASFIIDRFKDGHVSASAANCDYVLVMMLDDIGTKSKTPPLDPTWIMETSEGSFQWGYAFSEQPTKAAFAAAIKAIADAGYTDPGACNPVRNFRLPGSINLKPNKNNFAARLVHFNPEREYTLEQICKALNVTPVPVESLELRPIRISDDGADDVMAWLSQQGLLLSHPNPEGWAGVICPNKDAHTDGNPEGRYMPATRAYRCLHSHCVDFDSKTFLDWVAANGGPKHTTGLREELLAQVMDAAISKLQPTDAFPDAGAELIAEVERREIGRVEKADWYNRFAYIQADDNYFDMNDRRELSRGTFNALFRHVTCFSIHPSKVKRRIEASVCFDENRQAMGAHALAGITYAAGESVLVTREGQVYGNRWADARPTPIAGDITLWLDHLHRMIPDEREREHMLDVIAHKVQHPDIKINHAILHIGRQGSGKDSLYEPFLWAVGGARTSRRNVAIVRNEEVQSQWGYNYESEIMVFEELRQTEAKDRRALENQLKPVIAAPPEFISVNRKGMHPYQALNRMFVLAFSNERVPLSLPSEDRRWFVVYSEAPRMSDEAGAKLWKWLDNGGCAAVAAWLHKRDVSKFNAGATPPMTEAKAIMVEQGRSGAESFLVDQLENRLGEFSKGVVASPFYALCDRLAGLAGNKIPQAALLHALKEAGWLDMGRIGTREYQTKKHLFCAPDMADLGKAELRRLAEDVPAASAVRLVK